MNPIKWYALFFFIAVARASRVEYTQHLIDPWGEARETCRKEVGLTPEQLASAKNDLRSIVPFLICKALFLGNMNRDGTLNREVLIKNLEPLNPVTVVVPIIDCCSAQVYKGQPPNPHYYGVQLADFITCYKSFLPESMWDVIGLLQPPFYNRLNQCHRY